MLIKPKEMTKKNIYESEAVFKYKPCLWHLFHEINDVKNWQRSRENKQRERGGDKEKKRKIKGKRNYCG
jgi:hypothetical protein